MGYRILEQYPTYMEENRARFHLRHGFTMVAAAVDGTHTPYTPNSPKEALNCKNYKMWTSLLNIAAVNSFYCFVELVVGWPGIFHDKTCTENSNFWHAMQDDRDVWLSKQGVCVADSGWRSGLWLAMKPFTVLDGSTKSINGTILYTVQHGFFVRKHSAVGKIASDVCSIRFTLLSNIQRL